MKLEQLLDQVYEAADGSERVQRYHERHETQSAWALSCRPIPGAVLALRSPAKSSNMARNDHASRSASRS